MREFFEVLFLSALYALHHVLPGFANAFQGLAQHAHTYWRRFGMRHDQRFLPEGAEEDDDSEEVVFPLSRGSSSEN